VYNLCLAYISSQVPYCILIDEHPEYEECGIPDEEFNKPEDDNEEESEAARKNTGGKRLPQKQLPKKKILVGPPNPPKSK